MLKYLLLAGALLCLVSPAEARQRHHHTRIIAHPACQDIFCWFGTQQAQPVAPRARQPRETASYAPGVVHSVSGATAHVAASATHAFQCLVDRLEAAGYPVRFMGGWRAHGSVPGSLHPSGLALDVNQLSRNVTRPPMPSNEIALANGCGLISGRQWANGDSGHFQLGGWAGGGRRHYASWHRRRYASAAR
jgi:hypothetical protein